jgi:hypothetical protein
MWNLHDWGTISVAVVGFVASWAAFKERLTGHELLDVTRFQNVESLLREVRADVKSLLKNSDERL